MFKVIAVLSMLFVTSISYSHDGPPDPRRIVYIQHHSYIQGVYHGIDAAGGYRNLRDQAIMKDFFYQWQTALEGFLQELDNISLPEGEYVSSEKLLQIYIKHLKNNQIFCGNPIWTDTGTLKYCK